MKIMTRGGGAQSHSGFFGAFSMYSYCPDHTMEYPDGISMDLIHNFFGIFNIGTQIHAPDIHINPGRSSGIFTLDYRQVPL